MCGGDGAAATDASVDSPGSETPCVMCGGPFGACSRFDACVDADDGLDISCPSGGRGEGARVSMVGPILRGGRLLIMVSGLARRSTGADPWRMGGSVKAVVAVVDGQRS